jgi:hypothetical protein
MTNRTSITIDRPREEVQSLWGDPDWARDAQAEVTYRDAPGDRGTEIHVELGKVGVAGKLTGSSLAKTKDHLRRFKQRVETGEVPRSDGSPEGERVERKFKQRPAQPLDASELEKAGV